MPFRNVLNWYRSRIKHSGLDMSSKLGNQFICLFRMYQGFPGGLSGKESAFQAGDSGSIHGSERSPGEGNGYPLQCSCLENPTDRGAWWVTVHGVAKSWTRLSDHTTTVRRECYSL